MDLSIAICSDKLILLNLTWPNQSIGFQISVFIGPVFVALLSVFGFAIRLTDIPPLYVWLHYVSFVRSSFQSIVNSMYGFGRDDLPCTDELYCHFKNLRKFLVEMQMIGINIYHEFFYICFFFVCTYVLTTTVIWYRLNKR